MSAPGAAGRVPHGVDVTGILQERLTSRVRAVRQCEGEALAITLGEGVDPEIDSGRLMPLFDSRAPPTATSPRAAGPTYGLDHEL